MVYLNLTVLRINFFNLNEDCECNKDTFYDNNL